MSAISQKSQFDATNHHRGILGLDNTYGDDQTRASSTILVGVSVARRT
jgi:hypothetical protein